MLPRVVGELDNQQVPAFRAAADAVHVRDVGALGRGSLQQTVHLGVGGVDKLDNGAGLFRVEASQGQLLSGWKQRQGRGISPRREAEPQFGSISFFYLVVPSAGQSSPPAHWRRSGHSPGSTARPFRWPRRRGRSPSLRRRTCCGRASPSCCCGRARR